MNLKYLCTYRMYNLKPIDNVNTARITIFMKTCRMNGKKYEFNPQRQSTKQFNRNCINTYYVLMLVHIWNLAHPSVQTVITLRLWMEERK